MGKNHIIQIKILWSRGFDKRLKAYVNHLQQGKRSELKFASGIQELAFMGNRSISSTCDNNNEENFMHNYAVKNNKNNRIFMILESYKHAE